MLFLGSNIIGSTKSRRTKVAGMTMATSSHDAGLLEAKLHGSSAAEQVVIVDGENKVIGNATRAVMKVYNLPHRATYIVVRNSSGLYYVQRRSSTKDYCPGLLEPMAGGVVKFDEAYDESAARELEEEMGIRGVPLTHIATFPYSSPPMLIWRGLYDCVYDGPVTKQDEEVSEILLLSEQQILDREQDITPDGMFAFRAYLATRPRAI
ncbi:hypothetical protein H310_01203 [Aphanomyces invadans]|uniref:Nudix hydrolase domain-containing protein n=1 Tax=Aphanomyces invadans TaxID=157072 RepID=A0A024USL5_9STRA|nr:hypothetical protein H310_01203 [Aphanomyces invadans]ETW08673.1 hypothetical protein H310_01203 [Aphanomyces invadans]|eukprot:XP_008862478.1 hypothetical protein H310_01203 [Aphanomyces invadans]